MRSPETNLLRVARVSYGLAALIGALALWGWAIDVAWMRDLGADFAPMSLAEAIAFLLLGASFHASHQEGFSGKRSAYIAAAVAAATGCAEETMPFRPSDSTGPGRLPSSRRQAPSSNIPQS